MVVVIIMEAGDVNVVVLVMVVVVVVVIQIKQPHVWHPLGWSPQNLTEFVGQRLFYISTTESQQLSPHTMLHTSG